MIFDATPGARPLPNRAQLAALDTHYETLREKAKAHAGD
jgi:hypothetical protein